MISITADNRSLISVAPYSFLVDNHAGGVNTLTLVNTDGMVVGDMLLVGLFGNGTAEIFRIGSINESAQTITLLDRSGASTSTTFAHEESTRVSIIPYDQIRFYWTALLGTIADETPTFASTTPLTSWQDIIPSDWFTTYNDEGHSTGFGWFVFRNSVTATESQNSNAVPYAGFAANSVQQIFSDFTSLLNNKELKLVTNDDMFSWLNEGIAIMKNKLNLSNPEYTVSTEQSLAIVVSTSEYQLPSDFSDLVQITDGESNPMAIPMITIANAMSYNGDTTKYYIRGRYIGFVPTPSATATYKYRYRSKGSRVTDLDDLIDVPDSGFYILKDWMMWRASLKFQNPNAATYYKSFADGLNTMIASSVKRDANQDTWGISSYANA